MGLIQLNSHILESVRLPMLRYRARLSLVASIHPFYVIVDSYSTILIGLVVLNDTIIFYSPTGGKPASPKVR